MEARSIVRARTRRTRVAALGTLTLVTALAAVGPTGAQLAGAASAHPTVPAACSNATPITLGDTPIPGTISDGSQVDCYTFDGIVGDRVHITVSVTDGTLVPSTEVDDPSDATLCGPTTDPEQTCQLATSGTHTIMIRDSTSTETGSYTLVAQPLHPACTNTNPITLGDPATTGSISAEGQADCYTFDGIVGDRVHINVVETDGTLEANTSVIDPSDSTVCGPTTAAEQTCQLASTGTHTILIRDSAATNTGGYTVSADQLHPACTNTNPITLGDAATTGSISAEGQADCYTFSTFAGDRVHINVVATDGNLVPNTALLGPDDTVVCGPSTDADQRCRLLVAGTYTIQIRDAAATNTGGYTVFAESIAPTCADVVPIGFGATSLTGSITGDGDAHCYSFNGQFKGNVRVRVVKTGGAVEPYTSVMNPTGFTTCGPSTQVEQTCATTSTDKYQIMIQDLQGSNTGDYTVYIQRFKKPRRCTPISFGAPAIAGAIEVPGDADCYTFRAQPGLRVRVRVVETDGTLVANTEILSPRGTPTLCGPTADTEITCRIVDGRSHTIFVRDLDGPNLGGYRIYAQLSIPQGCTSTRIARLETGAITVPGNVDCWTFAGSSGDRIRLRVVGVDGTLQPNSEIVNPNFVTMCGPSTAIEQTCRLSSTGKFVIMIRDVGAGTGSYAFVVQRLNLPMRCTPINLGDPPLAASIEAAAETDCFTFSGVGGTRVHVDVVGVDGTLQPNTELINVTGTTLCGPTTDTELSCRLTTTGTLTILVRDLTGTGTGNYTVAASSGGP